MREKLGSLVLWASVIVVLGPSWCWGRFVVEKNNLKVTSPETVRGVYECAIGNFGVPQYGGTMVGSIFYPKANQKACTTFQDSDISWKNKPGGVPVFILADRGGAVPCHALNINLFMFIMFPYVYMRCLITC